MNGKGDKPRPVDRAKYESHYDRIFRKTDQGGTDVSILDKAGRWGHPYTIREDDPILLAMERVCMAAIVFETDEGIHPGASIAERVDYQKKIDAIEGELSHATCALREMVDQP